MGEQSLTYFAYVCFMPRNDGVFLPYCCAYHELCVRTVFRPIVPRRPYLPFFPKNTKKGPVIATGPFSRETELKLLPMPLQVALDGRKLVRVGRAKSPVFIDIDQARILKMQNHIWVMIAIHVHETQRDRDQIIAVAIELWSDVDTGFGSISTWKFDHLYTPVEI